jgi:hypothetical protein
MKDICKHTPIVYAVKEGHADVVDVFHCSKRVSPKAGDGYKELLFHEAVEAEKCDVVQARPQDSPQMGPTPLAHSPFIGAP